MVVKRSMAIDFRNVASILRMEEPRQSFSAQHRRQSDARLKGTGEVREHSSGGLRKYVSIRPPSPPTEQA